MNSKNLKFKKTFIVLAFITIGGVSAKKISNNKFGK